MILMIKIIMMILMMIFDHDPLDRLTSKFPHVRHPWLPSTNRGRSRLLPDSPAGTICNCNWISFHNLTFANKPSRWWTPAAVRWKCEGDPLLEIWNTLQLVFFINRIWTKCFHHHSERGPRFWMIKTEMVFCYPGFDNWSDEQHIFIIKKIPWLWQ